MEWQKHLDKIGDPLKTFSQAIDSNIATAFGKIFGQTITSQAGNYTLLTSDQGKFIKFTATATLTLLAAATAGTGFAIAVVNDSTGIVTIDGATSETINGDTTVALGPGESAVLTSDGSAWAATVHRIFGNTVLSKSGNYTTVLGDRGSLIEFTATATLTLLPAATAGNGFVVSVFNNTSAGTVTVEGDTSETINGATNISIGEEYGAILFCDGSKWLAIISAGATAGEVTYFAANSPPSGFLECDGSAISRTTYARLFAVIAEVFGSGDGSSTFNIPDLRGEFVRGWDNGAGVDSGRVFGSSQSAANLAHTHTMEMADTDSGSGDTVDVFVTDFDTIVQIGDIVNVATSSSGSEARPRNVALMACIRY